MNSEQTETVLVPRWSWKTKISTSLPSSYSPEVPGGWEEQRETFLGPQLDRKRSAACKTSRMCCVLLSGLLQILKVSQVPHTQQERNFYKTLNTLTL